MKTGKYNKYGVDKKILRYIIRDSYAATLVFGILLYGLRAHLPDHFAEGFIYGSLLSTTNLYLLGKFIRATITPGRINKLAAAVTGPGQLAVLTAYLYGFSKHWFSDAAMVVGFSFPLAMIVFEGMIQKKRKGSNNERTWSS